MHGDLLNSLIALRIIDDRGLTYKFLRTTSEVLLGVKAAKSHNLRTSTSGNSASIKSGGAIARRRDLDREYHLHYWSPTTTGLELSVVVPHKVMTIPSLTRG